MGIILFFFLAVIEVVLMVWTLVSCEAMLSNIAGSQSGVYHMTDLVTFPSVQDTSKSIVDKISSYIRKNYSQALSLEFLATQVAYIRPAYLNRLFKKETGRILSSYINHVRMERACELLMEKEFMTYQIAEMVGIRDPEYFSKLF